LPQAELREVRRYMSASSARQSQRVLIDAPVRLTLREASRTVPARALDLSEGGIRITADATLNVGDEVTCSLELDNERATLNGHVRWSKPSAVPAGAMGFGVQFGPLDEEQLGQLRRWLAQNTEHAEVVLLHVPSMREPLRARGCVTADGLQLVAALPQLAPGAELEFQLGDTGSRRLGRIERIDVKPRSEHGAIELAVRLQPSAATTRSRRNLVYGFGDGESVEYTPPPSPTPPRPAQPSAIVFASSAGEGATSLTTTTRIERRRGRTHTLQIPKTSAMRLIRWGLGLAAVGGLAVWLVSLAADDEESRQRHAETELQAEATEQSTSVSAATSASSANHTAAHLPQAPATTNPIDAPAPIASSPPPSAPPAAVTRAPAPQDSATKSQTPDQAATASTDEARLPALNSEDGKSEIFVPMQGSLDGLRTTQWTDPLAVVLDIPGAHFAAPELLKGLRGGGVKRVRIDETRPVPRLQIFLNTVAARFAAKSVPHGLLVVLEHDLRPLPH
jgi:Tfp pilus assembly protein PilZ